MASLVELLDAVPEKNRASLNKKVEDRAIIAKVAHTIPEWAVAANFFPGVKKPDVDAIKHDNSSLNEQKVALVDKWIEKNGHKATYRALAECLFKAGAKDSVDALCKEFGAHAGADSRATVHHGREQVDGPTHGSASQSATAVHGQEQTEGPKQHEKMRENIDELKKMYAELSSHAAREMSSKDYKFRRSSLYYLPNPKKEHKDDVEEAIEKAKSADDDVIDVFEEHHDYLNYLLLKHIIDSFGSDELKKRMADYVTRMEAFRKETRLEIFSKFTCDHPKEACGDECTIVFDMDWATATLDDMEQFRATFCRGLSLQDFSLSLLKVSKGCVRSSWRIPRMLWPYIKKYSPALLTYLVGKTTIININIGGQQSLQPPGRT
jgi:hypothetical protein